MIEKALNFNLSLASTCFGIFLGTFMKDGKNLSMLNCFILPCCDTYWGFAKWFKSEFYGNFSGFLICLFGETERPLLCWIFCGLKEIICSKFNFSWASDSFSWLWLVIWTVLTFSLFDKAYYKNSWDIFTCLNCGFKMGVNPL